MIASATTAQKLYNAILALPQVDEDQGVCYDLPPTDFKLAFQTAKQEIIPTCLSSKKNCITIDGKYAYRGGTYIVNQKFYQTWQAILAGATFAPARPDQLEIGLDDRHSHSDIRVQNTTLQNNLYHNIRVLPAGSYQNNCPSEKDKIVDKGIFYQLYFTQWHLPVETLSVYEGSCKLIEDQTFETSTGSDGLVYYSTADVTFWALLHQASGTK